MQFEKLGPYRLGKKLGQGGMGSVYQGVDESSGDLAAIKVLSPHLAGEEGFRVRFEAEIESLKKLRHPNIVRLYGYGEQDEYLFYAMELVEGTSLEEELRAGRRFHWREVTQLAIKLCKALKHAHDHGIIHRDIKPANLLLSTTGEIRLSDFGIARLFGNTRLTNDGGVLGTAEYMAPEQADGRPVTDRCDQYSLGGVMYALLAGRPPFRASSLVEMLQLQRFAEPPPVRRYAPDTPTELDRIIGQLLEKEPQKRFVNALILARVLEAMDRGLSISSQRLDFSIPGDEHLDAAQPPIDALGPTLVPGELPLPLRGESTAPGVELGVSVLPDSRSAAPVESPRPAAPAVGGRFTKVEDSVADGSTWRDDLFSALSSWQTIATALALLAIGLFAWYSLRGPSADKLFGQIETAALDNDPAALQAAQPHISDFLARFPEDHRRSQVQGWADRAQELSARRRAENRSRKLKIEGARSPVERAYSDAMSLKIQDPALAVRKFQAIVDLYGGPEDEEDEWVKLAGEELRRLEKQAAEDIRADRKVIESQLAEADRLATTDPAAARKMRQAVITLYGEKPWAEPLVEQARAALGDPAQSESATSNP
jgi:serine/threonine-protein kinase